MGKASRDPFGLLGTVVDGRYRVESLAGQGGFGVVYRAHHLAFDAPIALKVLKLPEQWTADKKRARTAGFQREGRMLFKLSLLHSSIVRAFETGTVTSADGSIAPYLALEWLEGVSLEQELRHRRARGLAPFELTEVFELLHAPATALSLAHGEGVVHRDLKPGNLFVSALNGEPAVKILDFGIAKVMTDPGGETAGQQAVNARATASFTPMYAAPEQWLDRFGATGTWTDVHAWALVCVELLTGKPPLSGREPEQFMAACLDAEVRPTPRAFGVELPAEVEAVFARALAIDPSARFRDVGAFWSALSRAAKWSLPQSKGMVEVAALRATDAAGESPTARTETATSSALLTRATSTTAGSLALTRSAKLRTSPPGRVVLTLSGFGLLLVGLLLAFASNRDAGPEPTTASVASSSPSRATASPNEQAPSPALPVASPVAASPRPVVEDAKPPEVQRPKKVRSRGSTDANPASSTAPARTLDAWDQRL